VPVPLHWVGTLVDALSAERVRLLLVRVHACTSYFCLCLHYRPLSSIHFFTSKVTVPDTLKAGLLVPILRGCTAHHVLLRIFLHMLCCCMQVEPEFVNLKSTLSTLFAFVCVSYAVLLHAG